MYKLSEEKKAYPQSTIQWFTENGLAGLINDLIYEKKDVNIKERTLKLINSYYNGLIIFEKDRNLERHQILSNIINMGKQVIGNYYSEKSTDYSQIINTIEPVLKKIKSEKYSVKENTRYLQDREKDVWKLGKSLTKLDKNKINIDTIVCVATGAFESALLAANILEKEKILALRYSTCKCGDKTVKHPYREEYIREELEDKNVLIIEDFICTGESILKVGEYVSNQKAKKIYLINTLVDSNIEKELREVIIKEYPRLQLITKNDKLLREQKRNSKK